MAQRRFELNVNGERREVTCDPDERLLWALRDHLGLTGTKYGCGEGSCGACSVLVDGQVQASCLTPVSSIEPDDEIVTIEGLARDGELSPVQRAFLEHNAFCCGFCTPGMIIGATGLLRENPDPSREEILDGMNVHVCRCGSYVQIIAAIEAAAAEGLGNAGHEEST